MRVRYRNISAEIEDCSLMSGDYRITKSKSFLSFFSVSALLQKKKRNIFVLTSPFFPSSFSGHTNNKEDGNQSA